MSSHPKMYSRYEDLFKDAQPVQQKTQEPNPPQQSGNACMEVQNLEHRKKILTENSIVCVYLHGTFCAPCKFIAPLYANLAQEYNSPGRCMLVKEDVDLDLTRDFNVTGVPAFIFYAYGKPVRKDEKNLMQIIGGDLKQVRGVLDKLLSPQQNQHPRQENRENNGGLQNMKYQNHQNQVRPGTAGPTGQQKGVRPAPFNGQ